jgi:hypothetical protein
LTVGRPGLHGALLARGPAHVVRLSELFALLALSNSIKAAHLEWALAWWDYNVKSVEMIFSDRTGNADADRIKAELLPGEKLDLHALPAPARERFGIGLEFPGRRTSATRRARCLGGGGRTIGGCRRGNAHLARLRAPGTRKMRTAPPAVRRLTS